MKLPMRLPSSRKTRRAGGAMVEFAVIVPIIFLVLVSIFEFSRVLMLQHTADAAAYEAARAAMVPGATASEGKEAGQFLLAANKLRAASIIIVPESIDEETAFISVTVEVPFAKNSWIPPFWFSKSTVRSEVSLICERPPLVLLTGIPEMRSKLLGLGILGL